MSLRLITVVFRITKQDQTKIFCSSHRLLTQTLRRTARPLLLRRRERACTGRLIVNGSVVQCSGLNISSVLNVIRNVAGPISQAASRDDAREKLALLLLPSEKDPICFTFIKRTTT